MRTVNTFAVALMILAAAGLAMASDSPQITIAQSSLDLGEVDQGKQLDLLYEVQNTGRSELEITVRPTCGCTVVKSVDTIPAGNTGTIHATIDTTKFSGPITKSLMVLSNDPEQPTVKLTAKAVVNPY